MDLKSKGIRWVESIYQTLETVCEDYDTTMSQAPTKYIGNQVHTVGKGVKKFCSSVMQDLLPPKIDLGKVDGPEKSPEESDYIEGYIESRNMLEDEFYMNGEQPVEVHGATDSLNQGTVNSVQSSSQVERHESNINQTYTFCKSFDIGINAVTTPDALSQLNVSSQSTVTELESSLMVEKPHANGSFFHEFTAPEHEYKHIETPCVGLYKCSTLDSDKGDFSSYADTLEDALPKNAKPTTDIVSKPVSKFGQNEFFQRANASKWSTISSDSNDVDPFRVSESETLSCSSGSMVEHGWESSTLESSVTFSDICISDDMCTDSDPLPEAFSVDSIKFMQPQRRRRRSLISYKKLLQDTLNSKKRLIKDYKQLGIWHGDIYEEHAATSTHLPAQPDAVSCPKDITENLSEWELL